MILVSKGCVSAKASFALEFYGLVFRAGLLPFHTAYWQASLLQFTRSYRSFVRQ